MNAKKLDVKDLINVAVFTILIFVVTFVSGMIGFIPILMPVVPVLGGLLTGSLYMLFATKIRKSGMLFIEQLIISLLFAATGHGPWIVLTAVIFGLCGEYILKKGNYISIKHARLAFSVATFTALGNWLPIFLARDAYIESMIKAGYGKEFADKMMSVLPNWSLPLLLLGGFIGMYIGCTIGIKLLNKHFVKAGMIKGI